jgi:Right handed beta helix region
MKLIILALSLFFIGQLTYGADIVDNFSKGGWKKITTTPGRLQVRKNKLFLEDKIGNSAWATASKTFEVDIDKTPLLVIKVMHVSDRGQVKLIQKNPYSKKPVLNIAKRGIYTVDLKLQCRWQGKQQIEVMLYASGDGGKITYNYVKFTDKLSKKELAEIKKAQLPPKNRQSFYLVPLFNTCGYYFVTPEKTAVNAFYRRKGGKWQKALAPVWISEEQLYRGSIVGLDENTDYEFKIVSGDKVLGIKAFKTWNQQVPIAKTIVLNEKNFKGYLKINHAGSPTGWIKYVAAPGFILKNSGSKPLLDLIEAKYILLEGLTLQGGGSSAVYVRNCQNVRFINCDISGWGRLGTQRFDKDGKYYTKKGRGINNDAGIYLIRSKNTVVERCYFHDPRNTANSWRYSHPAGPEGMMIAYPESTVVRYNDFIGSDEHRWNDAIEGAGNFYKDGGFNRDADIYGNMMIFANDDCVEIDGGQQNVRVFLNKFEGALCSVSIQGCMAGPSYVYRNLIVNMGDEFGTAGQLIKSSSHYAGKDAVSFIFNNTVTGPGRSLPLHRLFKIEAKNNIFAGSGGIGGRTKCKKSEPDYNLVPADKPGDEKHGIFGKQPKFENAPAGLYTPLKSCPSVGKGIAIDNFTAGDKVDIGAIAQGSNLVLPYRPIPVMLDQYQLNFSVKNGKLPAPQIVTATVGGKKFSADYKIRQNNVFNWFSVTPSAGKLKSGDKLKFTVKLNPEMMKERLLYRGVFLVRLQNGYSRPVVIYAKTDVKAPMKPEKKGVFTLYFEAEKPTDGKPYKVIKDKNASGKKCVYVDGARNEPAEYSFDIPKSGKYFILMRVKSEAPVGSHDSLRFSIDGDKMDSARLKSAESWIWALAANTNSSLTKLQIYKLKKGKHTISIMPRESIYLDAIVITDNPKIFEQR